MAETPSAKVEWRYVNAAAPVIVLQDRGGQETFENSGVIDRRTLQTFYDLTTEIPGIPTTCWNNHGANYCCGNKEHFDFTESCAFTAEREIRIFSGAANISRTKEFSQAETQTAHWKITHCRLQEKVR